MHPSASPDDIKFVEETLKAPVDIGTVNNGTSLVGACSVANSKGIIVSLGTTGPELARIEEAFGFLEGIFMKTKIFRIQGKFMMGDTLHPFTRELKGIDERDIKEKIYSEFGSKHHIIRSKIRIEEIVEISPEEIQDPFNQISPQGVIQYGREKKTGSNGK